MSLTGMLREESAAKSARKRVRRGERWLQLAARIRHNCGGTYTSLLAHPRAAEVHAKCLDHSWKVGMYGLTILPAALAAEVAAEVKLKEMGLSRKGAGKGVGVRLAGLPDTRMETAGGREARICDLVQSTVDDMVGRSGDIAGLYGAYGDHIDWSAAFVATRLRDMVTQHLLDLHATMGLATFRKDESGRPEETETHYWVKKRKTERGWAESRKAALEYYGHRCSVCGKEKHLHVHHMLPRKDGGKDDIENLQVLCHDHHREAHAKARSTTPRLIRPRSNAA